MFPQQGAIDILLVILGDRVWVWSQLSVSGSAHTVQSSGLGAGVPDGVSAQAARPKRPDCDRRQRPDATMTGDPTTRVRERGRVHDDGYTLIYTEVYEIGSHRAGRRDRGANRTGRARPVAPAL